MALSMPPLSMMLTGELVRRSLSFRMSMKGVVRIVLANVVLVATVVALRDVNWLVSIPAGAIAYGAALVAFGAIRKDDWQLMKDAVKGSGPGPDDSRGSGGAPDLTKSVESRNGK